MAEIKRYVTPVFRLSFPSLFEASSYDGGEPKYGCSAIWTPGKFTEKDKARWKEIMGALDAEAKARFKKAWKDLPSNIKRGVRDGAEKSLEGYGEGTRFASLTTKMRPGVVDAERRTIAKDDKEREKLEADDKPVADAVGSEAIYPGCYCRATVTVYSYDNKGKGVALGLMNIQKVADGERLDSRTDASEDFEDDIDEAWLDQDEGDAGGEDPFD
ncbi:DUF2815 family protein [Brucella abortus]|uniref:ssDNA-binding protein n=1 Tax=Brucella abortus TaxID=235 RepID=UPI0005C7BE46|nr:ssDNA-binding protein [Brucella abortus]RUQ67371.1 DUF2815 family protein [Brucella abortus]RUQ78574.1 DUF2815 family protein [Brucella abortus]RUQ88316.1 DUF2815 family protein [Brucella abortus]RUQ90272.1 DUF2815 family protein [Brucella abortus]RUQ96510.1 DUF2815 family protein [Brucella abortus]